MIYYQCNSQETDNYISGRKKMVDNQIKKRGISDKKVLEAMLKVPRHLFVPENYQEYAYADHPLPIGEGQTISQPYIVALMTDVLDLDSSSKVLEIGTGSGYQAAILAEICKSVYTIEIFKSLGETAKNLFTTLGYQNVNIKTGDGYLGWEENEPYDAIIVTCAPTHIPVPLKEQLIEGGKMIIPVGDSYTQELVLLEKKSGKIIRKDIIGVRFVPMINIEGDKY